MTKITLCPFNGGLGDSLLLSTLPELFARELGIEVNISTINYPFRNDGIWELVWKNNPFVKNVLKFNTNYGEIKHLSLGKTLNQLLIKYNNNIQAAEAYFGFEPKNIYPKIYWQPKYNDNLRNKIILDPAGITMPFNKESFEPYVKWLLENESIKIDDMLLLDSGHANYDNNIFPEIPRIQSDDIFDYASMIYSCKMFLTSESGGAALASAIKGSNIYPSIKAIMSTMTHNRRQWAWANIDYFYTGKMTGDF